MHGWKAILHNYRSSDKKKGVHYECTKQDSETFNLPP